LATISRQFSMKNTMGYGLNSFVDFARPVDILSHLMVGSEGTLGFVGEATFDTIPAHPHAATGLLIFPSLAEAAAALSDLTALALTTIELMDATSLRVAQAQSAVPPQLRGLHLDQQTALLVEIQAATVDELNDRRAALGALTRTLSLHGSPGLTTDEVERQQLWKTRKGLYTTVADARPVGTNALLEDIGVPVPALHDTCEALIRLLTEHRYDDGAVIFGHAKDGNLHFMLTERFDLPESVQQRYQRFTDDLVDLVLSHGGTLKAEHGTGRIMAAFVERQYGTELYQVMRHLKRLVDPHRVLNPDAVLSDDPTSYLRHLKIQPSVEAEVDRCVECGYCETLCPSKNLTTTPRQRIVLRRQIVAADQRGDHDLAEQLRADYRYDGGIDTRAVDGMCSTICPVQINTDDLVRRLRSELQPSPVQSGAAMAANRWRTPT
jgi:D-lactate dehydrogenase